MPQDPIAYPLTVFCDSDLIGAVEKHADGFHALDATGVLIGAFETEDEANEAVADRCPKHRLIP